MKKAVILTLMYAILFTMAVGSFSLYTTSVPNIASTVIGTKVFDVSQTPAYSVSDTLNLGPNNTSWVFMALNSDTANTYDTNITITLNTAATDDKLGVSVYANTNPSTALVSGTFAVNSKTLILTINKQFQGASSPISMTLQYTYNGNLLTTSNKPSGFGSVLQATVTVNGTINNTRSDKEIIDYIINNSLCYMSIKPRNKNFIDVNSYWSIGPDSSSYKLSIKSGSIRIHLTKTAFKTDITVLENTTEIQSKTSLSAYSSPNKIVLDFADFSMNYKISITEMKLSINSTEILNYSEVFDDQKILLNLPVGTDGSFDVSFQFFLPDDFVKGSKIPVFTIYFGNDNIQ